MILVHMEAYGMFPEGHRDTWLYREDSAVDAGYECFSNLAISISSNPFFRQGRSFLSFSLSLFLSPALR